MTTLFFVMTYGLPLGMVFYAYLTERAKRKKLYGNSGMRL